MRQAKEGSLKALFQEYEKALTDVRRSVWAFERDKQAIENLKSKLPLRVRELKALQEIAQDVARRIKTWTPKGE